MSGGSKNRRYDTLADRLRGFIRRPQIRVFSIETCAADRQDVVRIVGGFEHHADNRSPFFPARVADSSCARSAWVDVLRALQERHAELRSAGAPVGSLPPYNVGAEPAAAVSVVLAGISSEVQAPAEGTLVALDLNGNAEPALLDQLTTMVRSRELDRVRFVVLGEPGAKIEAWAARIGSDKAWFYRLEPAPDVRATQTAQALEAEEQHGPGVRGAWPYGVRPPPRPGWRSTNPEGRAAPSAAPPTETRSLADGIPRESAGPAAAIDTPDTADTTDFEHELSLLVRRAAAEMQQERGPEALRLQTQARELCREHGQPVRAVEMEMMLGGYLMRLDQPRLAAATFVRADESAYEHQAYGLASRARLNEGVAHEADDSVVDAIRAYRRAIETGKGIGESPRIVFEAYRRAGEAALKEGLEIDCIGLWADAVAYGKELEPDQRGAPLKDLAKRLSEMLTRHRRYSQAREIDRIAEQF